MAWLTDFFTNTGLMLTDYLLVPLLIWTASAGLLVLILRKTDRLSPDYHYYLRVAVLFALPAGILGTILAEFLSGFFAEPTALAMIVIQNPIATTSTNVATSAASEGVQPAFWLGLCGFLLMLISSINLLRIINHHLELLSWTRNLEYSSLTEVTSRFQLKIDTVTAKKMNTSVAFTGKAAVPFTYGWIKPRIILPTALEDQPEKLQMALRHEMSHIRQRDFVLHYISSIIRSLFWFHPLTTFLHKSIQQQSEILCDAEVLADPQPVSISRKAYAELILEFATQTPKSAIAVNMASPKSSLKNRIAMISTTSQTRPNLQNSLLVSFVTAGLLVLAVSCTDIGNNGITNSEVEQVQSSLKMEQNSKKPVYIINGEQWNTPEQKEKLRRVKTEYIDNIEVLKGEKALQEYGEAGKNGVVKITLVNPDKALTDLKNPGSVSSSASPGDKDFYITVENPPQIIGGLSSIQKHINYPERARKAGKEGQVIVQFIVNEQGNVENPKVVRSLGNGFDEEAIRVVKKAKFEPGYQNGKAVPVKFMLPIHFKLNDSDSVDKENTSES